MSKKATGRKLNGKERIVENYLIMHGFVNATGLRIINGKKIETLLDPELGKWGQRDDMTIVLSEHGKRVWIYWGNLPCRTKNFLIGNLGKGKLPISLPTIEDPLLIKIFGRIADPYCTL